MIQRVVSALSEALEAIVPAGQVSAVILEDSSVRIFLRHTEVTLLFLEPDTYPFSGAFLSCDDPGLSSKLEHLAEKLQDKAPLTATLAQVIQSRLFELCSSPSCRPMQPAQLPQLFHACFDYQAQTCT